MSTIPLGKTSHFLFTLDRSICLMVLSDSVIHTKNDRALFLKKWAKIFIFRKILLALWKIPHSDKALHCYEQKYTMIFIEMTQWAKIWKKCNFRTGAAIFVSEAKINFIFRNFFEEHEATIHKYTFLPFLDHCDCDSEICISNFESIKNFRLVLCMYLY